MFTVFKATKDKKKCDVITNRNKEVSNGSSKKKKSVAEKYN